MDSNSDIAIGQVVKSKAGRDKGRIFLVVKIIDENHVSIIDGDLRKLDNPKVKKLKHLNVYNAVVPELRYKIDNKIKLNNAFIRKILEPFNEEV